MRQTALREDCTGALDLLPLVAVLLAHPRWDVVRRLIALDALKAATCPCQERCSLYQQEILQQHQLAQLNAPDCPRFDD